MTSATFVEPLDYPIYNEWANKAVSFINGLTHGKTLRKPGEPPLESPKNGIPFNLRPWQEMKVIRPIFGLVDEYGVRTVRTAYMEIPRKNGKSSLAAGIGLKCLAADGEAEPEVYCVASDREQASIVFNAAKGMVLRNPLLSAKCKIIDSRKRILYGPNGGVLAALSKEAFSKEGYNASALIYDEVHAAKNRELWEVLTDSMGARLQPLVFAITTAGFDTNSLWGELREYAFRVRDGDLIDPSFLPILYCAPKNADWKDRKLWFSVNPAMGDYRKTEEFEEKFQKALEIPSRQNRFRRVYLCQETEQENRWLDVDLWKKRQQVLNFDNFKGRIAYVGLDLASTIDIAAAVFLFPDDDHGCILYPFFFVPEENLRAKGRLDQADYESWVRDGHLIATPGNVIDYEYIEELLKEKAQIVRIEQVLIDRWNATHLATRLSKFLTVTLFGQGFASMSAPTKELEARLLSGKIVVADNPVFRWMASNVQIKEDAAQNIKPVKPEKESRKRIDGIVAAIMALGGWTTTNSSGSVYDSRGVVVW